MILGTYIITHGTADKPVKAEGCDIAYTLQNGATCHLSGVEPGTLQIGERIRVTHAVEKKKHILFEGTLRSKTIRRASGTIRYEDFTAEDAVAALARTIYKQPRMFQVGTDAPASKLSSRVILNQRENGTAATLYEQIKDILTYAGISSQIITDQLDSISNPLGDLRAQVLPMEEIRDVTCLQALARLLRFFPAAGIVAHDGGVLVRLVTAPPAGTSSFISTLNMTALTETAGDAPCGVVLEIEKVGSYQGEATIAREFQTAGETDGKMDVIHATLQLAGVEYSSSFQSVTIHTEALPSDLNDVDWWMQKHPRLNGKNKDHVTIEEAARSGQTPQHYSHIVTSSAIPDIKAAGKNARIETFTAIATITEPTPDGADSGYGGGVANQEERIFLTMELVTTDVIAPEGKEYKWRTGQDFQSAEETPDGLAQAHYDAHKQAARTIEITAALSGQSFEGARTLIDAAYDGLGLRTASLDCSSDTLNLFFGVTPLAAEEMAAVITGFRNHHRACSHTSRGSGKVADQAKDEIDSNIVAPAKTTDSAPGNTIIKTFGKGSKTATIDTTRLPAGEPAAIRELTILTPGTDPGTVIPRTLYALCTEGTEGAPIEIKGSLPDGTKIPGKVGIVSGGTGENDYLTQTAYVWSEEQSLFIESSESGDVEHIGDLPAGEPGPEGPQGEKGEDGEKGEKGDPGTVETKALTVVTSVDYDANSTPPKFTRTMRSVTVIAGGESSEASETFDIVSLVPHSQEHPSD